MGKKLKYIILAGALVFLCYGVYGQIDKGPPTPGTQSQQTDPRRGPCGQLPIGGGRGNPPPPPPGLCLPINDYLTPLLLAGIVLGAFKVWRIEEAK